MADEVEALRAELMEAAAGADEELMEKFFETMELSAEDMAKGLKIGVREGSVCPVLCGSALTGMGVDMLMQTILDLVPVPAEMTPPPTITTSKFVFIFSLLLSEIYFTQAQQ